MKTTRFSPAAGGPSCQIILLESGKPWKIRKQELIVLPPVVIVRMPRRGCCRGGLALCWGGLCCCLRRSRHFGLRQTSSFLSCILCGEQRRSQQPGQSHCKQGSAEFHSIHPSLHFQCGKKLTEHDRPWRSAKSIVGNRAPIRPLVLPEQGTEHRRDQHFSPAKETGGQRCGWPPLRMEQAQSLMADTTSRPALGCRSCPGPESASCRPY